MQPNLIKLKESYDKAEREADAFRKALEDQISDLLSQNSLPIAIPIESRTKKWSSILVKLDRLAESWEDVSQIWDLVGLRIVFLFPEEVAGACGLIERNFEIVYRENTSQRLSSNEFGYCVGVALLNDKVSIINTKSKGPTVEFTLNEWTAFLQGVKAGEFDPECLPKS